MQQIIQGRLMVRVFYGLIVYKKDIISVQVCLP